LGYINFILEANYVDVNGRWQSWVNIMRVNLPLVWKRWGMVCSYLKGNIG